MKRVFFKSIITVVVAAMVVSCDKSTLEDNNLLLDNSGAVLSVSELSTRINFEDEDNKISLSWEEGDTFTLYNSTGARVDDFECSSLEDLKFTSVTTTTTLEDEEKYTAIYPASEELTLEAAKAAINPYEQNGDDIKNLNNSCYMLANFTYSESSTDATVTFEHQMAIITFKFNSTGKTPAKLVFLNEAEMYTVTYNTIEPDVDGLYTSHIMIYPSSKSVHNLVFELFENEATEPYELRVLAVDMAITAGKRYTASIEDYVDYFFSGGSGTLEDPYKISNALDLRQLSINVNVLKESYSDEYFIMTNNIDLEGIDGDGAGVKENEFTPIGNKNEDFSGNFNGAGYTVSGLYVNKDSETYIDENCYIGLFGSVYNGIIRNVSVEGSLTGCYTVGGVVGSIFSNNSSKYVVINCHNNAKVSGYGSIGGVVGVATNSYIVNSYNTGEVSGGSNIGGVAGYTTSYSKIINCFSSAKVTGTSNIGGVTGHIDGGCSTKYCYWDNSIDGAPSIGIGTGTGMSTDINSKSTSDMQDYTFVTLLNDNAYSYNTSDDVTTNACAWKEVSSSLPILNFGVVPTSSVVE